jgi:hypothetical protein
LDHPGELAAWDAEECPDAAKHPVGARAG